MTFETDSKRANVAPATVTRLKLRGDFTGNAASERIRQALIADGLWPEDGEAATVQCDLPIQNPVHMQIKKAELAKKIEEVRKL